MKTTTCPACDGEGRSHGLDDLDCGRCGGTGAVDYEDLDDSDDLGMDPDDNPGIGVFEYRVWSRWLASERKRVGVVLTNKGCVRRQRRACRRAFKRLSAMRRQGKGGGR